MPKSIFITLLAAALGLVVTQAQSQVMTPETPGMSVISAVAHNAPTLQKILMGEIPATIEEYVSFADASGAICTYQPGGPTATSSNAFFSSEITSNGRTCFTCHQPQNNWEISPPQILFQLLRTQGRSALFQPIDAANCPNLPGATARFSSSSFLTSRSQLLNRGNFRISLNAPNPQGRMDGSYMTFDGNTDPEWVLTVEYDPFGCENDAEYGLPSNLISVYRRPLPSTNVAFLNRDHPDFNSVLEAKLDIMWDSREPSLESQFINATLFHGQTTVVPDDASVSQGARFQSQMFTAQCYDNKAGDLTGSDGSGVLGGPVNLYDWRETVVPPVPPCEEDSVSGEIICAGIKVKETLADGTRVNVGSELYAAFATPTTRNPVREAKRESIARGETIFSTKVFSINKVAGLNDIKQDADGTEPGTCSTCHSNKNVNNDTASDPKRLGIMDNSNDVNVMPWTPDFPRFAFYCPTGSIPFFSNTVTSRNCPGSTPNNPATCDEFITTDPGKGLITGKCQDLGKMKVPVLRGLAARAPYFHGGNAATLMDVVNFYNNRFNIGLTDSEKEDLVNFLSSL